MTNPNDSWTDFGEDVKRTIQQAVASGDFTNLNSEIKDLTEGDGLGLPICKELTEQMGGTIEINSTEGKGTVVWIVIPATASAINRKNDY